MSYFVRSLGKASIPQTPIPGLTGGDQAEGFIVTKASNIVLLAGKSIV